MKCIPRPDDADLGRVIIERVDPRLITVPPAVARAAVESGVAGGHHRFETPRLDLSGRLDPTAGALARLWNRSSARRVVFAEGEEEKVVRAAVAYHRLVTVRADRT